MSDNRDYIEVPVFFHPLYVHEDIIKEKKQKELAESAEARMKQDEELTELINEEGFYNIYPEQEGEYLVEEAMLTCSLATKKDLVIQNDTYKSGMNVSGFIFDRPETSLKVNLKNEKLDGYIPANIYDSKKIKNITPFGNCMSMLTAQDVLRIKQMGAVTKQLGICHCLMELNKEWENLPSINSADLFEFPSEENEEKPYGITRTSILFCKRGGIISALTSGQKPLSETEQFIKDILEALKWTTDSKELHEIVDVLNKFNITDRNSIACFLLLCVSETGAEGLYSGEIARDNKPYVDERGRAVTEYYPEGYENDVNYDFEARGVGYIMVTGYEDQKRCLEYLKEKKFYDKDLDIDSMTGGYIDELRKNPWAVSAWRWAIYEQPEDTNLNDYVSERVEDNNGSLILGIVFTAESFVNGVVSEDVNKGTIIDENANARSNTMNDALHYIARGEIPYIEKSEYKISDSYKGWYTENERLYVDGWRYRAPENWDTFQDNYNILKEQEIIQ